VRLIKQKDEEVTAEKSELEAKNEAENLPLNELKSELLMKLSVFEQEKTRIQTVQTPIIHDIEKTLMQVEAEAKKLVRPRRSGACVSVARYLLCAVLHYRLQWGTNLQVCLCCAFRC